MVFFDMPGLIKSDESVKPGGSSYDRTAIDLSKFYDDSAQAEIRAFLQAVGLGDRFNESPLDLSMLRRIIDDQSVVYSTPPVRALEIDGLTLGDDSPDQRALNRVLSIMLYDQHWAMIDQLRNLYRNVAICFQESDPHGCVQMRIFEPFNVRRRVDPRAPDSMDADAAVAFQTTAGSEPAQDTYELWLRADDGRWTLNVVNGLGQLVGVQPYGDAGVSPFGAVAPFMMVYDEIPRGRPYLVQNANRLGFCKNAAGVLNDLVYLIKQEAHSTIAVSTDDARGLPTESGPGKIWSMPGDATVSAINTQPKIRESAEQLDRILRYFATSESLPGDTFNADKAPSTGIALKVKERALARRRRAQVPMVAPNEARAYRKLVTVHNVYHDRWGLPRLPENAELIAIAADSWQPTEQRELQEIYFKDIAVGAASIIGYLMQRTGLTRTQAIEEYARIQADRENYPVTNQQNPAALADGGPHVATGAGGAKKVPGAFNPELETSTEGASVTDAVRRSIEPPPN